MTRLVPILSGCCAVAIAATMWSMLRGDATARVAAPPAAAGTRANGEVGAELRQARRTCSMEQLDRIVGQLAERAQRAPDDRAAWLLYAESLLERAQLRGHLRGLAIGTPLHDELPPELQRDLDAGTAAIARARELGEDSADAFLVEASLLSQRITGIAAALQWNGRIEAALAAASVRKQDDPRLHLALGVRSLLAPRGFGHDPVKALTHLEFAADALADDERPAVFAGMASYLQKKRVQAIEWLERAVQRNSQNVFARVVLARLRRGDDDPFGRDVTAAEAASGK